MFTSATHYQMEALRHAIESFKKLTAYVFVDGAYLRHELQPDQWRVDPHTLTDALSPHLEVGSTGAVVKRTLWFDAIADGEQDVEEYLTDVGTCDGVVLAEGVVVSSGKRRRQKQVDGLLAVHALTGAFRGRYDIAVIVAGDSDYVPMVRAIRDAGPHVVVAGFERNTSQDLRLAADRSLFLPPKGDAFWKQIDAE